MCFMVIHKPQWECLSWGCTVNPYDWIDDHRLIMGTHLTFDGGHADNATLPGSPWLRKGIHVLFLGDRGTAFLFVITRLHAAGPRSPSLSAARSTKACPHRWVNGWLQLPEAPVDWKIFHLNHSKNHGCTGVIILYIYTVHFKHDSIMLSSVANFGAVPPEGW